MEKNVGRVVEKRKGKTRPGEKLRNLARGRRGQVDKNSRGGEKKALIEEKVHIKEILSFPPQD